MKLIKTSTELKKKQMNLNQSTKLKTRVMHVIKFYIFFYPKDYFSFNYMTINRIRILLDGIFKKKNMTSA